MLVDDEDKNGGLTVDEAVAALTGWGKNTTRNSKYRYLHPRPARCPSERMSACLWNGETESGHLALASFTTKTSTT